MFIMFFLFHTSLATNTNSSAGSFAFPSSYGQRQRDLFPLPPIDQINATRAGASVSIRRRLARRRRVIDYANDVIGVLNDVYAPHASREVSGTIEKNVGSYLATLPSRTNASQRRAQTAILEQAGVGLPSDDLHVCRAAMTELLATDLAYYGPVPYGEESQTTVRPYVKDLVNLPKAAAKIPQLFSVGDASSIDMLNDNGHQMFVSAEEAASLSGRASHVRCYMDERLASNVNMYFDFVVDLWKSNLLGLTRTPRELVTPFFVAKKDGTLRMVWDCRVANSMFAKPPPLNQPSGASWTRLRKPDHDAVPDAQLWTAKQDIRSYFHFLGLKGHPVCECFCLPPIPSSLLDRLPGWEQYGTVLMDQDVVWPMLEFAPMGWSWAMWFAQRTMMHQVCLATGLKSSRILCDHAPVPDLSKGEPVLLPYCDNSHVAGIDRQRVDQCNNRIRDHLVEVGFEVHEFEDAQLKCTSLGYVVDGSRWMVSGEPQRISKVRAAFFQLSRRPRVQGRAVEKLLGHAIHVLLPRRDLLSLPRSIYDFIHQHYDLPGRLWRSAARECYHIALLLPLAFAKLDRGLCCETFMYDACLTGVAVAASPNPKDVDIRSIVDTPERHRYVCSSDLNPREAALSNYELRALQEVMPPQTDQRLCDDFGRNSTFLSCRRILSVQSLGHYGLLHG